MAVESKSSVSGGVNKTKVKSSYPTIQIMVNEAIKELKERNGSSVHAIRKYLGATYNATSDVVYMHMKRCLRSAVIEGKLVQTKGHGAYGSFKLPAAKKLKALNQPKSTAVKKLTMQPQNRAVAVPKKNNDIKKPKAVVKKAATGIKKATTKKPVVKDRAAFKIVIKIVKPSKPKTDTVKNTKTSKSRNTSKN